MPVLFVCYVIAYVDRQNVAIAKLQMQKDLPSFDDAVIGFGAGIFFLGYFLLEIPGSILVEKWSARKWICRIMISWGIVAALTAFVSQPWHFYTARFCLGLAEAGFFPGVIVYISHWFPAQDRGKALSIFLIASPFAQVLSPKISGYFLMFGASEKVGDVMVEYPLLMGLEGWQWVYIIWGLPAILMGFLVLKLMPDRPKDAKWLSTEERFALQSAIDQSSGSAAKRKDLSIFKAFRHPRVVLLTAIYFTAVTAAYSIEFFMPTILREWYKLSINEITWLIMLPPLLAVFGQLAVGWSTDRFGHRLWHVIILLTIAAVAFIVTPMTATVTATIAALMVAFCAMKSYLPAFWALPNLFFTSIAAAGSVGLINSVGNLGGFAGPAIFGYVSARTQNLSLALWIVAGFLSVAIALTFLVRHIVILEDKDDATPFVS